MTRAHAVCTEAYLNSPEVQKALHANVTGINYPWTACNLIVNENWKEAPKSMLPIYQELIAASLKIWVYSGDTDSVVPVSASRYSIGGLGLPTRISWYPWYSSNEVGGWSQVYEGLTLVTVRGAGHEVPLHRPAEGLMLFEHFLQDKPMPSLTEKASNVNIVLPTIEDEKTAAVGAR